MKQFQASKPAQQLIYFVEYTVDIELYKCTVKDD